MNLLIELRQRRVMAIVRAAGPENLASVVCTLVDSGIALVELPLTSPGAFEALRECARVPGALLGAGTVLTAADGRRAVDCGAQYLVTPAVVPDVVAAELGVPVVTGCFTATEALMAMQGGATAAKLFPASMGGPAYLSALRQPLPDIPFIAVGGVAIEDAPDYLAAGAIAVGIGSPLICDAAQGGSLHALAARARALLAAVS